MTKRTRLSPVYLTSDDRLLVRSALETLSHAIEPGYVEKGSAIQFARRYTRTRLLELRGLFSEKGDTATEAKS